MFATTNEHVNIMRSSTFSSAFYCVTAPIIFNIADFELSAFTRRFISGFTKAIIKRHASNAIDDSVNDQTKLNIARFYTSISRSKFYSEITTLIQEVFKKQYDTEMSRSIDDDKLSAKGSQAKLDKILAIGRKNIVQNHSASKSLWQKTINSRGHTLNVKAKLFKVYVINGISFHTMNASLVMSVFIKTGVNLASDSSYMIGYMLGSSLNKMTFARNTLAAYNAYHYADMIKRQLENTSDISMLSSTVELCANMMSAQYILLMSYVAFSAYLSGSIIENSSAEFLYHRGSHHFYGKERAIDYEKATDESENLSIGFVSEFKEMLKERYLQISHKICDLGEKIGGVSNLFDYAKVKDLACSIYGIYNPRQLKREVKNFMQDGVFSFFENLGASHALDHERSIT